MVSLISFFFALFFGFFNLFYFYFLFFFTMVFMFFEFGTFWFGGFLFCDSLSFFFLYLTIVVFLFCFFSSVIENWVSNYFFPFFFILGGIFFLLLVSFTSLNVFLFYICFELIFMLMYIFVLVWGYSPERVQASFYMVFYTIVVSFPFLIFLVVFEQSFKTFKFLCFFSFDSYWWMFIFLVFLVKLPVYGVHLWLPKAHVEAPVSGSMVLAGILLKLGGYGFIRFSFFVSLTFFGYLGYFLSIGLVGGLLSCVLCLRQADLKAFVAYSSVCHMGFGLSGIYCYSFVGLNGGIYMFVAHGFCSSCMFYLLFILYERFHTRSVFILKGMGTLVPSFVLPWFIFSILNMGVPPSFSFFSEVFILVGLSSLIFYICILSGVLLFLAGVYNIFFFVVSCHGSPVLDSVSSNISIREYLVLYGHFFPLIFIPFFILFFFV